MRGIALVVPNIHGSTGYGRAWQAAIHQDWGGIDLRDLRAVSDWMTKQPDFDQKRLAVYGGSYGGFATLLCVTRIPDLWRCAVDVFGVANLITMVENAQPNWRRFLARWIGDVERDREKLVERSPITHIENVRCPMLILQGENDPRVPQEESDQVVERLRALGRRVEYVVYPGEGHGFTKRANAEDAYGRIVKFLTQELRRDLAERTSEKDAVRPVRTRRTCRKDVVRRAAAVRDALRRSRRARHPAHRPPRGHRCGDRPRSGGPATRERCGRRRARDARPRASRAPACCRPRRAARRRARRCASVVHTTSPTRRSSTARSPSGVAMRVPTARQIGHGGCPAAARDDHGDAPAPTRVRRRARRSLAGLHRDVVEGPHIVDGLQRQRVQRLPLAVDRELLVGGVRGIRSFSRDDDRGERLGVLL